MEHSYQIISDSEKCEEILAFKTNLSFKKDVKKISGLLNSEAEIMKWNVDLSDIDRILRVQPTQISANKIIEIVTAAGYSCEELTD